MPRRRRPPKPSAGELEILGVLWSRGPATVRDVHEVVGRDRPVGYTTVLKTMQIMAAKGLLVRDESHRSHVYRPALERRRTQRELVRDLLDRVFGGSAPQLVMQALAVRTAPADEIAEVRALLARHLRQRRRRT